ncbi:MAG: hypothetical protein ACRD1L_01825 [Terriglobales bacterium]
MPKPPARAAPRARTRQAWPCGSVLLALAGLVGCAQVGPVLPPSAGLPRPPHDLTATRSGPGLILRWTLPTSTSDGVPWPGPTAYNLCVWPGVERARSPAAAPPPPAHATIAVPPQIPSPPRPDLGGAETPSGATMAACPHLQPMGAAASGVTLALAALAANGDFATVALYALNPQGQGAGWSNPVVVPLTPVGPPPQIDSALATADGVALAWSLPTPPPVRVAIYRDGTLLAAVPPAPGAYLDAAAGIGQLYTYWLRSAAGEGAAAVESADSSHMQVDTHNALPPPAPTGLEAVVAPGANGGVDLSWNAVRVRDLAGYNFYRQLPGSSVWEKLNPAPLPTPVFHDALPPDAPAASYAVSAVDLLGHESPRTPPVIVRR